jgi:hypothetical protein
MRILIIQENGRHEKNKNFRECFSLKRGFEFNKQEVVVWGLNHQNFSDDFYNLEKWCDVILILENYNTKWLPIQVLKESKKIKIFWSIDSHCVLNNHLDFCKNIGVNIVLNSTKDYLPHFKNVSNSYFWLPNAYDDDLIYPKNIEKIIDIGFCGNVNNRGSWLSFLEKFNIKKDIFVIGDDMVNSINSYKIHFNRNISNDINYRTFETTGCDTLLFTNYTNNLEELFEIDKEIVVYNSIEDLNEKVTYFLKNEKIREEISKKGFLRTKENHTYKNRTEDIIKILNNF